MVKGHKYELAYCTDNIALLGWIHFPKIDLEKNILYYKRFATFYIKYGEKPFKKALK